MHERLVVAARKNCQDTTADSPAALEEFSAQGFARASISNISKRAGVAKGTVYNYFPTKELLFEAVLKEFIATVRTELESSPPQRGNRKSLSVESDVTCRQEN